MKTISPAAPMACPERTQWLLKQLRTDRRGPHQYEVLRHRASSWQFAQIQAGGCLASVEADIVWVKQAAATGCRHTHRALWTLWMLIRVNQLDSTSQTFTTNVLVDLTWQLPMRLLWPVSKSWCMLMLELLFRTGNGSLAKIIACQKWVA